LVCAVPGPGVRGSSSLALDEFMRMMPREEVGLVEKKEAMKAWRALTRQACLVGGRWEEGDVVRDWEQSRTM